MTVKTVSPAHTLTATGCVGGYSSRFATTLRDGTPTQATVPVTLTLPVSLEDIEALLWVQLCGGWSIEDLTNDAVVHELVLTTLLDERGTDITDARDYLSLIDPTSVDYTDAAWVRADWIRRRVAELYGTSQTAPQPRRDLVEV